MSKKTANSYHNLGESMLVNSDFAKAKIYFTKATENLDDHSLDDFLSETDPSYRKAVIKYRIVLVELWNKFRRHDCVIDEAYLGLSCAEDDSSKSLFFAHIFHNAISRYTQHVIDLSSTVQSFLFQPL